MAGKKEFHYNPPLLTLDPGGLPDWTTAAAFIWQGDRLLLEKRSQLRL